MLVQKFLTKNIFLILFFNIIYNPFSLSSETYIKKSKEEILPQINLANNLITSQYLVDTGDSLYINFRNIEIFSNSYNVDANGQLLLPELGLYTVRGKTIKEIKSELIEKYREVIINPYIDIAIAGYRPLNVYINGEVNRPGLYQLAYSKNKEAKIPVRFRNYGYFKNSQTELSSNTFPRLFDALKLVDGLTNKADLSQIRIIRNNSKKFGGGKIQAKVNILNLLRNGDQSQNIKLFDGDYIFIPASENILLDQLIDVNKTNLNPREVEIFITGNVRKPGRVLLRQNSSLMEGIMAAGGKKDSSGNIEFIRLRRDGKSDKRILGSKYIANKGSYTNPILISGDIIVVKKNILGKLTNVISEVGNPVINTYGIYKLFD